VLDVHLAFSLVHGLLAHPHAILNSSVKTAHVNLMQADVLAQLEFFFLKYA